MFTDTKNLLLGTNGTKGVILRSGIIVAFFATLKIILTGWVAGDIWGAVEPQWDTLSTVWIAAILVLLGNPSKKVNGSG